ncbi:MAG: hypothetical protein KDJ73_11565 [Notoacmeibacter sp.]|nr:hypothetical protein [Notoacmeibacter sp.]
MKPATLIHLFLLAACLNTQLHRDFFQMSGMRRAVETATKETYKPAQLPAVFMARG